MTDDFNDMISHFPDDDSEWTENQWKAFLKGLVSQGLVSYKEVASCVLGMLNPPQVGTSIASNASFKSHYPKRKCWETVRNWFYSQTGKCADCNTRLDLQADHIIPREELGGEADYIDNLTLRCRRCNVVKGPRIKMVEKLF
jgi:5-methylcytosine-specific restriction endonuclease McrA